MDSRAFLDGYPGRLVPTDGGALAFLPSAPPADLDLEASVVSAIDDASAAVGELAGISRRVRNPQLLIAPYLRREALLSSRIEGTQSTLTDLFSVEAGQETLFETTDVREVVNYVETLEYGWSRLDTLPLSKRLIRELHRTLMTGVRGGDQRPGELRQAQNWLGSAGDLIGAARYVPPPPGLVEGALDELENFLHRDDVQPLLAAGIAHYQFEAIHPFIDGNGRVGRLLIPLILHARGRLPQPVLYVSGFFERTREEYYERLLRVSTHGDWQGWLTYFLRGVEMQARSAIADADRLVALEAQLHARLYASRARATAHELLDRLFVNPMVTARRAVEQIGVTDPAARAAIRVLEEHGILREMTGRDYGRRWVADEIFDAIRGVDEGRGT